MKPALWALLVALICFLVILGLFCLSASAGGAHWGDTTFGCLFFVGCIVGCIASYNVFEGVATILTKYAQKVHGNAKAE